MSKKRNALSVMLEKVDSNISGSSPISSGKSMYQDEWNELCRLSESGLPQLQQYALRMGLHSSRFRSIVWQLLLETLPLSPSLWVSILRMQRHKYRLLRQKFTVNPHFSDLDDNPLSQSSASKWHQYFCDKELRAMIRQDVVRAFPGVEFFRCESIQCTMVNVLFCYARQHPDTCYRQGMHEVLAPIIYVMHRDHQSLLQAQEVSCLSVQTVEIFDPTCLEEDAYFLFSSLMSHLAGSYHVPNVIPSVTGQFPTASCKKVPKPGTSESEVASRLKWIRDNLLSQFDFELYQHVVNLDIPFQTFGIRWLRVLFGQEFPLTDLLHLWDAIFAEADGFDLVNYIVVAMLSAIREELLCRDDNECLMLLMRYPCGVSVQSVVELALHIRKPEKYPSPLLNNEKQAPMASNLKNVNPINISGRLKQFSQWSQRKGSSSTAKPVPPTLPNSSISWSEKSDGRQGIIEGYLLNDPAVVKAELQHSQTMLLLVHNHLERYHFTLENTLPPNTPAAARLALAGIKELCVQLRHVLPPAPRITEVEAASEAEPAPASTSGRSHATQTLNPRSVLPQTPNDCPLTEIKISEEIMCKSHFPQDDPLQALCYVPSDSAKHVSYCKILGTRLN